MMKTISKITMLLIIQLLLFLSCATTPPPKDRANLTVGVVKERINKGETTQADVLKIFGSPNLVTRNSSGNEVWSYTRMSYERRSSSLGGTIIVFGGGSAFTSTSSSSFDLIIEFDENDIVQEYTVISAQY